MKRKRLIIFGTATLALSAACGVGVYAQTLAGTSAAIGAGATLGAAGGAGLLTPSQYAAPATSAGAQRGGIMDDTMGGAPEAADGAGANGATAAQTKTPPKPIRWSNESGSDMLRQLTQTRTSKVTPSKTRTSSRSAQRVGRMTKAQRTKAVNAKYKKPAVGYLSWYLPEDRFKVSSKVWQFVTTPNDKFYYRPWAPAMKLRNPSRVIGFHTWQDAMIAGYRPDPVTKPEPGAQLARLASLTDGSNLSTYAEYVYAGQVTPTAFDANYKYVDYVAKLVASKSHTRHLVGSTVDQVLGASMGLNPYPRYVGGAPAQATTLEASANEQLTTIGAGGDVPPGNLDRREDQYNQFGQRAGGLARKPGQ